MRNTKSVHDRVIEILEIFSGNVELQDNTCIKDFELDSLNLIELSIELELEFDLLIEDGQEDYFLNMTVIQLCEFINERLKQAAGN